MTTMDAVVRMLVAGHPYQLGKEDGVSTNQLPLCCSSFDKEALPIGPVSWHCPFLHQRNGGLDGPA